MRWVAIVCFVCVLHLMAEESRAEMDLFPDKVTVTHAKGFSVSYHGHYKIVRILKPWRDATETFEYVLVQRGHPVPKGYATHQIFTVPVKGFVTLSTSMLPYVDVLNLHDELVGISDSRVVHTPSILEMIRAGKLKDVGSGAKLDIEMLVDLSPGLVMAIGYGNPQGDVHHRLISLGIPVVLNADYMESHPLGRAEWLKFAALFFNREAQAEAFFAEVSRAYEDLLSRTQSVSHRPTVVTGISWRGTWYTPGGQSYMARLLADAGADYLWKDDPTSGSLPLDFETVFARAQGAEFWVNTGMWRTMEEVLAADERYGAFRAFQTRRMYHRNRRVNKNGGNDYWETGLVNPHLILADLIKIFHPELVPDHKWVWYEKLEKGN